MSNVIYMQDQSDWFVMGLVKEHLKILKRTNAGGVNNEDIMRNEAALRSFFGDIKERSKLAA